MSKHLVIVESPAKAKTIKKYLGKGFEVMASYGHVRDLLPKNGAVDTEHDFAMKYELIEKNARHVSSISKAMKAADALYLATDPDREGEAISWHLYELLKDRGLLNDKLVKRVVFHEITKQAINDAVANPRDLSMDLINAQQARRALDYLVGFNLSPLLWKKIRRGLSAGRVQSPALRLIVEREEEIEKFKPKEYWTVDADVQEPKKKGKKQSLPFIGKLNLYSGKKVSQFSLNSEELAHGARDSLLATANGKLTVNKVEKKQRRQQPSPPFITSTLQQEAARKLGFTAQRTMSIAQQLYEGIDTGDGAVGLITYMRTDSVNLAQEAVDELRNVITQRYGAESLPKNPRAFKTKSKNAQEAHEAIRPTSALRHPDEIKDRLKPEQLKLYTLIWRRTVACQMVHATLNMVAIDLSCGEGNNFRATGSVLAKPGFRQVYMEGMDDDKKPDDEERLLPPLKEGEEINLLGIRADQHFTEPPPRYSEARLIKTLEEHGIGRPSTYASIISTLQNREYVELDKKRFIPTDVGRIVNKFLTEHFSQYVDYKFTAKLEDELDAVSRGEQEWVPLLKRFWTKFDKLIKDKTESVQRKDVTHEELDEKCPECDSPLSIRLGKRGKFIGCTNYPECKYTRNMDGTESSNEPEVVEGRTCPKCDSALHIKLGRYGKFIGCSAYPKCKHIEPLEKPKDTGVECPECKQANLMEKKSRYGKIFYSCSRYPDCKYAIWNPPLKEPCPKCGWPVLTIKTTKRRGTEKVCPQKECDYAEQIPGEDKDANDPH
ncbi:type I DNA topoisomerase [Candidatus Venteria ishoeyi]|uniref:DNA topoisomerase 1 n=1 Tax=Candidatus Venteria ishoeyi TaxID=1899563 RepID=A0A1H6FFD2_9GAMM|nr:type I DNA topoisomerase [Candidatus Venteria ishoeyi]SEH08343.1 DNA topoisomerase 1 [Candidatus Venteria ishoeyi]